MYRATALLLLAIAVLAACGTTKGELRPGDDESEIGGIFLSQPQLVTFTALQDDPEAYQDQLVRVSGSFFRLPAPECVIFTGPGTSWSLIADKLRLDALGFEESLQLVRPGTGLTVDGIFRKYEGPLGCGKRPPVDVAWYLETIRIVQPNPIARAIGTLDSSMSPVQPPAMWSPTPLSTIMVTEQSTQAATATSSGSIPTATPTAFGSATLIPTPTVSGTPPTQVVTVTPSPSGTQTNGTATVIPSPTPTLGPGTSQPTPTNTIQPTPGPTQPPISTSTPGGYPPPTPPTPSSSPTGYPLR